MWLWEDMIKICIMLRSLIGQTARTGWKYEILDSAGLRATFKGDVRGKCFPQRLVSTYNALPGPLVKAYTIVTFNRHLDKHIDRRDWGDFD